MKFWLFMSFWLVGFDENDYNNSFLGSENDLVREFDDVWLINSTRFSSSNWFVSLFDNNEWFRGGDNALVRVFDSNIWLIDSATFLFSN